jgi:hypothetical protein
MGRTNVAIHRRTPGRNCDARRNSDGIAFVYYPQTNRGIWYERTDKALGVGMLGPNELKALAEIVSETGHF